MKQRINLYQPALQPQPQHYALSGLLRIVGGCGLAIVAGIAVLQYQLQQQQQQLSGITSAVNLKSTELGNLQQALDNRQPDQVLQLQASQLSQDIAQKQQLLQYLTADQRDNRPRFAAVLQHLSAEDLPQFWLNSFRFGQRGISFQGVTGDAALVPVWLQRLGQTPYFSGQQFSSVGLQPLKDQYLQFQVSSLQSPVQPERAP